MQAKTVKRAAEHLEDKFSELDIWLDGFARAVSARAETAASQLVQPLRASVSSFIDENLERDDVGRRWKRKVEALKIEKWRARHDRTGPARLFASRVTAGADLPWWPSAGNCPLRSPRSPPGKSI